MMYYLWDSPIINSVWGVIMMFGMIFFLILLTVVIVLFVKELLAKNSGISQTKSSVDILKDRYAKGEIDREEFQAKLKDLQ